MTKEFKTIVAHALDCMDCHCTGMENACQARSVSGAMTLAQAMEISPPLFEAIKREYDLDAGERFNERKAEQARRWINDSE